MARTHIIRIEQAALEPWREDIDIIDAALIHHVLVRLTRRLNQRTIVYEGEPCVWVHYPTVRAENWLINLGQEALKKRFKKLVKLGLLISKQQSKQQLCRPLRRYRP